MAENRPDWTRLSLPHPVDRLCDNRCGCAGISINGEAIDDRLTAEMIEIILELKLDSFLVNGMSASSARLGRLPLRALRFSCAKIASARQLTDDTPSASYDFLESASTLEAGVESDRVFDEQILKYLSTHATVDTSRVLVALDSSEVPASSGDEGSVGIGHMSLAELPHQNSVNLEMVLRRDEFDAAWGLTAEQKVRKVIATLVCFKPAAEAVDQRSGTALAASILSGSLRLLPDF